MQISHYTVAGFSEQFCVHIMQPFSNYVGDMVSIVGQKIHHVIWSTLCMVALNSSSSLYIIMLNKNSLEAVKKRCSQVK